MHITTYLRVPAWFLNRRGCRHTPYTQASAGSQSLQSWKRGASADTTRRCLGSGQPVLLLVDQWRRSPLDYHAQSSSAGLVFWACQRLSPADWPLIQVPSSLACVKSGLPRHCSWSGCPISWFQTPSAPQSASFHYKSTGASLYIHTSDSTVRMSIKLAGRARVCGCNL